MTRRLVPFAVFLALLAAIRLTGEIDQVGWGGTILGLAAVATVVGGVWAAGIELRDRSNRD